jgi:hypothetical protein
MAVTLKKEIVPRVHTLVSNTTAAEQKRHTSLLRLAIAKTHTQGCENTPPQKSEIDNPKIRILEGVRRDDVLEMVRITSKLVTVATTEMPALMTIKSNLLSL